jgi:predicted nucleic acid-binding protein
MSFSSIATGSGIFVDANIFVYAFAPDPHWGPPCRNLLERIELGELLGFTSSHVLCDVAHRLMTLEACAVFGWPYAGIAARLQRHANEISQLSRFRQAVEAISLIGVQVSPVTARHVESATARSQQFGLLSNDALVVAIMQDHGWTQLASHDADFDRVPGITRHAPDPP